MLLCCAAATSCFAQATGFFNNHFTDPAELQEWQPTNPYSKGQAIIDQTTNGFLFYYVSSPSQPWQDTVVSPGGAYYIYPSLKLTRSFSGNEWIFETKVLYTIPQSATGRQFVTWICFGDRNNSIRFAREARQLGRGATHDRMRCTVTLDGSVSQQVDLMPSGTGTDLYNFRIIRGIEDAAGNLDDKKIQAFWSTDAGVTWTQFGTDITLSAQTAALSQYVMLNGGALNSIDPLISEDIIDAYAMYDYIKVGGTKGVLFDGVDFSSGSEIESQDKEKLASGGREIEAATADGVTRLLLRLNVSEPGTADFWVDNVADGSLSPITNQSNTSTNVSNVPSVSTSLGEKIFAVYKVPDNFVSTSQDEHACEREITINIKYTSNSGGASQDLTQKIKLKRPPVVLIHGLWADLNVWYDSGFVSILKSSIPAIEIITPTYANASHFSNNFSIINSFLKSEIRRIRNSGIAISQVDVITHSMGGVLSRLITQSSNFRTRENFKEGYFNKLITIDTPHQGAFLADLIVFIRDVHLSPLERLALQFILNKAGYPIDRGAIDDSTQINFMLNPLKFVDLPCYTVVGDVTSMNVGDLANLPGIIGDFFNILKYFGMNTNFSLPEHDLIVEGISQRGGLSIPATDKFLHLHFNSNLPYPYVGALENIYVKDRVIFLLNTDVKSNDFQKLP